MMQIPLRAVPSQTLNILLGGQSCTINVYQKTHGLYLDLLLAGVAICTTVLCHDRVKLVRGTYQGFVGDLSFVDTMGTNDPYYTGLGTRYQLVYLDTADLTSM